jgi:hypothetical protein
MVGDDRAQAATAREIREIAGRILSGVTRRSTPRGGPCRIRRRSRRDTIRNKSTAIGTSAPLALTSVMRGASIPPRTAPFVSRMTKRQKQFWMARTPQPAVVTATLGLVFLSTLTFSADARGIHGMGREFGGHGTHGPQFSGDRRRGNDAYTKAASEETDKLLTTKLKSICRGC